MALLTRKEIAHRLNIGVTCLQGLINKGLFPKPMKIGRLSRWKEDDLTAYVSQLEQIRPEAQMPNAS